MAVIREEVGTHSPSQLFLRIQEKTVLECLLLRKKNILWVIRMIHMTYKLSVVSLGFFLKRENLTPKATWHHCQLKCKTLRSWKKKKTIPWSEQTCVTYREWHPADCKPINGITEHPLCTNQVLHQVTNSSITEKPIVVSHGPSYPA